MSIMHYHSYQNNVEMMCGKSVMDQIRKIEKCSVKSLVLVAA